MPVDLDYAPGATPLDPDELAGLIPGHIATQGELNEWEQQNIQVGDDWARKQRKDIPSGGLPAPVAPAHVRRKPGVGRGRVPRIRQEHRRIDWLHIGTELRGAARRRAFPGRARQLPVGRNRGALPSPPGRHPPLRQRATARCCRFRL
ncbi:MAG: hypothetical protein MZV70_46890 [Desulfobacterales bacterium]|nr:hypothetical protein [Desulfobacterales bacterium]